MVGNVSDKAKDLCKVTKHALDEAIKICGPGVPIREVGRVSKLGYTAWLHRFVFSSETVLLTGKGAECKTTNLLQMVLAGSSIISTFAPDRKHAVLLMQCCEILT